MNRLIPAAILLIALLAAAGPSRAVQLSFQSGKSANLFWMVDQLSEWDPVHTSPSYRTYWSNKLELTDQDLMVLDQYARLRQRLARFSESEVRREISPWVSLFGSANILPHERFALAFLETRTPKDAVALLKLSDADQKVVMGTLIHFAKKLKNHYGTETAHLSNFSQKAHILISLADAGGFINEMKNFYGISGPLPQTIPVDVLWAPPGFVRPAHMGYHIILPVSVDKAETDEAVLQHLSMVIQEVGMYLLSKLPAETLSEASGTLLRECGLVNESRPEMVRAALQVALGEILFLRERFPDLPGRALFVPWDNSLEYPFAVDELARAYAEALKGYFNQTGGFYPGFVAKAVEIQKSLFPVRPRFFAPAGMLFGDLESREMFNGLFRDVDRLEVDIGASGDLISARKDHPNRAVFVVVSSPNERNMYQVLKRITNWRKLATSFRGLKKSSFIYPIVSRKGGPVFVIRGLTPDAVRKALMKLYNMTEMPSAPIVIK